MPCCAHCGSEVPEDAFTCPVCGAELKEIRSGKEATVFYRPYMFGIAGLLVGVGLSCYGLFSGLVHDPIGIFVPASGVILGIKGAVVAYGDGDECDMPSLATTVSAGLISAVFLVAYMLL